MKLVAEHLGEIILAVAGVALVVGVILAFDSTVGDFFSAILDKLEGVATDDTGIWATPTYTPGT
ncbi:MAG: hypothetical protein IJZ42_01505 [Lachnospiraceae bacterium]|nr:hypothetical protein [Lachnospiraceae bacterium]